MPRSKGTKNKTKTKTTTKTKIINRSKNTNINTVHVHVEKPKTRKRRTTKTNLEPNKPLSNSMNAISRGASQNLGFHPRGLVNNEIQQPTIIQQLQAPPDPRIEKLDKRTKKIKEYLKGKGETKDNAINVNSPGFQQAFRTPIDDPFSDAIEPKTLTFDTPKSKKGFFTKLFSSSKKSKSEEKPSFPLLEYKPPKTSPTAPSFIEVQSSTINTQTTPLKTGIETEKELKNLVNQLHQSHPHTKIHYGTFKSAIARKLKELGYNTRDTDIWVQKMRRFYDDIFAASNPGSEAAGGVM